MSLSAAMKHPEIFGPLLGPTWDAWHTIAKVLDGRPLNATERERYMKHTGRSDAPTRGMLADAWRTIRELWLIKGRRSGGSRFLALTAVHRTACVDYSRYLAAGEVGTFPIISADRKQSRNIKRYVEGFVDAVPALRAMVINRTADSIEFNNKTIIEIHTCSFRSTRGYTLLGAACDELAFWNVDGSSPDVETLAALRPGMSTIPSAILLCASTPYARRGALWQATEHHYGKDGDPALVWIADTRSLNPTVPQRVIDEALTADEPAARSEYLAEFRRDIANFVSREAVEAVVVPGRTALPPVKGFSYRAHLDAASGSGGDSLTGAVAHYDEALGMAVLDCTVEITPPFSPAAACEQVAAVFRQYGCSRAGGDRWGGDFVTEQMARCGIRLEPCSKNRSELYLGLAPLISAQRIQLLDDKRLIGQLLGLERRVGRLRDVVDHAPNGHDDLINAVAGALLAADAEPVVLFGADVNREFRRISPWAA